MDLDALLKRAAAAADAQADVRSPDSRPRGDMWAARRIAMPAAPSTRRACVRCGGPAEMTSAHGPVCADCYDDASDPE